MKRATSTQDPQVGDRVLAKGLPGTVAYVRMAPPGFRKPEAISVVLDEKKGTRGYQSTIFKPRDVVLAREPVQ